MALSLAVYLLIGAVAGMAAGLFGVGGGLIIVPALAYLFHHFEIASSSLMQLAVGTSLAVIIVTSASSLLAHHRHGAVQWNLFRTMAPSLVTGSALGAFVASRIASDHLKIVFGVVEILISLQMYFQFRPRPSRIIPGRSGLAGVSFFIGSVSAVAGIGGGTMMVPFLAWCNVSIHKAVATSAACGLPIAVAGTLGFILLAPTAIDLAQQAVGFVYWPAFLGIAIASTLAAPLGAKLAHQLSTDKLRRLFAVFLLLVGLVMLVT